MAKRGRKSGPTLADLARPLDELSAHRLNIVARIQEAAASLGGTTVSIDAVLPRRDRVGTTKAAKPKSDTETDKKTGKLRAAQKPRKSLGARKRLASKKAAAKA